MQALIITLRARKQDNQSCHGAGGRPAATHLQAQVFILLLGEQTEDDTGGGARPNADLDARLPRGRGPRELQLDVAPAVEGELWSHLSIENNTDGFN